MMVEVAWNQSVLLVDDVALVSETLFEGCCAC
jgi:hypothetical protein